MPSCVRCERVPPAHGAPWPAHALALALPQEDTLPLDPRSWRRAEVARWVARAGARPDRFPMNGKGLCLMTRDMFCAREPRHGHRLHHEFRQRLAKALAVQELFDKMIAK